MPLKREHENEPLSDTTIRVIGLLQASPLESRRAFGVFLFRHDDLAERIKTAWLILLGRKIEMPDHADARMYASDAI